MPCEKVRRKRVENAAILRGSRRPRREAEEASGCTLPSLENEQAYSLQPREHKQLPAPSEAFVPCPGHPDKV